METSNKYPHEYRIPVSQEYLRSLKNPHDEELTIIHAFVKIRDFENGTIPDRINPRSHEKIKARSRVPKAIQETLEVCPKLFHLLNRGCLILAKSAWYDNKSRTLHFIVESENEHGMVDGATTDRVLAQLKRERNIADFSTLKPREIPAEFKESYIHLEIIAGKINDDTRIKLADARNTSEQVKEFSLEDLGGGFEWLKDVLRNSEFRGKIRYRENEPKPVDVRTVLGLLTLFHPNWKDNKDPLVAYTGKGTVIELYRKPEWRDRYEKLAPVTVDILRLYDHIHVNFQRQYMTAYGPNSKLGRRSEVRYINSVELAKPLPLTGAKTQYVLTDGWLYPLLAAFRMLLKWPRGNKAQVTWAENPFEYFDKHGHALVSDVVEQSEELGSNPNAAGKSRMLWSGLRIKVENHLLRAQSRQAENSN